MRVHLVKEKTIRNYALANARSRVSFEEWLNKLGKADWKLPEDIQSTFGAADLLGRGSSRVVFDIAGDNYRMICKYGFGAKEVHLFVCWIGTHAEYDELCKKEKQFTVSDY